MKHPTLWERGNTRFLSHAFYLLEEQGNNPARLEPEIPVLLVALELAWQMQHQDALRLTQVCATTWWKHTYSLQQAEPYFQHGWELAQREQGQTLKSGILCLLALAHCASLRNETMQAIQLCGQAVVSAQTLKEEQHVLAMAFMALGIAYLRGAREYGHASFYANARLYCQEALDLAEALPRALQLHMPLMYKVLGTVTVEMGESSQQALAYYAHGITLAEAFHDTDEAGLLRLHSARVLFLQWELRASEAMVQQVLQLGTRDQQQRRGQKGKEGARTWYEHGLYRLLDILLYEHRVEEIKETLQKLQDIHASRKALLALYQGKFALMQQEYTQAEHCYQEALQLAHEQKERSPFLREVYNDLVLVAIGQQDVKKAFLHIGELQGSLHAAEGSIAQAYVHVRRAQFLSLWKLPEKARDEADLTLPIFQRSGHVLGMREVATCLEQIQASEDQA